MHVQIFCTIELVLGDLIGSSEPAYLDACVLKIVMLLLGWTGFDGLPALHVALLLLIWVLISSLVLLLLWSSSAFSVFYAAAAAAAAAAIYVRCSSECVLGASFLCFLSVK